MGFYDNIAKNINWEYATDVESYLKVVGDKLQLPNPKWLSYHLSYLDKVIEAIHAFEKGELRGKEYDLSNIHKTIIYDAVKAQLALMQLDCSSHEFVLDIETSNLSTDNTKNELLMIGVAWDETHGVVFMKDCFNDDVFKKDFQRFLNNEKYTFILQNGIFDKSRTELLSGLKIRIDEDTMLMHYCGINEHKGTHGLKALAQLYLGFPDWEAPLDDWKRKYCRTHKVKLKDFEYSYFDQQMLAEYNCYDVCSTFQLYRLFPKLMRNNSKYIYHKLCEASNYYSDMIVRGMMLDLTYIEELKDNYNKRIKELEEQLKIMMPGVLVTSPKQLLSWLEKKYPFDNIPGTGKNELNDLILKYPDDSKELQVLLEYRKVKKYLSTYVDAMLEKKDQDNVIHCEFKLHGTETGRLSSANPNMQNIPRNEKIKKMFIAHPGYKMLQLDYSQAELRVLAHISQDETLMNCYIEGRDLHSEMAAKIFKDKYDPHDKDQRVMAKTINFGIPYGRTANGIVEAFKISKTLAQQYLNDWFEGAPKVKDYIKKCHAMCMNDEQWYTEFGRTRHYFITNDNVWGVKNQAVNFPISSTANDLTIHSLIEIGDWLKAQKIDAYLVDTVHDSIVLEVREKDAPRVAAKCQEIMATVPKKLLKGLKVPFRADADFGDNYGELKELEVKYEEED